MNYRFTNSSIYSTSWQGVKKCCLGCTNPTVIFSSTKMFLTSMNNNVIISNQMILNAIWNKSAQANFSNANKIAQDQNACLFQFA